MLGPSSMVSSALFPVFSRLNVMFERGDGVWLYAENDSEPYLDMVSGFAANSLGHASPKLVSVLQDQASRLWHVSNLYRVREQEVLAERLVELSFADKVFFCNSGAEAVECALKTARRSAFVNGHPERVRFITFEGAFHGRTLATISAGGRKQYLEGFGEKLAEFDQVPFQDLEAVEAMIQPETVGVLIEPIQGEIGVRLASEHFLQKLRKVCTDNDLLLIFDEVQTGVGRTGKFFAYEWAGIAPDILALAKGLGGGFPIGACLATNKAAAGMTLKMHGSTLGGNILAMVVAEAVVEEVSSCRFLERVEQMGKLFKNKLQSISEEYSAIFDGVCGRGLLLGLRSKLPVMQVLEGMFNEKLLCSGTSSNVIRFLPALNVQEEHVYEAIKRIVAAIDKF